MALLVKIKNKFSHTMWKIAFILTLEAVITFIFLFCNNLYHLNSYRSLIIDNCTNELNNFLKNGEGTLDSILIYAKNASENPAVFNIMNASERPSYSECLTTSKVLKNEFTVSNVISRVSIYNQHGNFVVSSSGVHDTEAYFTRYSVYDKYPLSYWQMYRAVPGNTAILPPTSFVDENGTTSTVVPLVFTLSKGSDNLYSILTFDININTLHTSFQHYKLLPGSKLYMLNSASEVFAGTDSADLSSPDTALSASLQRNLRSSTDIVRVNGKKYLSIRSTQRSNLWGYTYLVLVPFSDINRSTYIINFVAVLFMLLLSIVQILYVGYGTKALYTPWRNLMLSVKKLRPANSDGSAVSAPDVPSYISAYMTSISETNAKLEQNLTATLPLGQERYLIDFLNDNRSDDISATPLSFQYDYFVSVSASITIKSQFFTDIPEVDPLQISYAVREAIRQLFSDRFITYSLPVSNNILYLLLNLEDDTCGDEIQNTIDYINNLFESDADNMSVIFGVGNIYKGLSGLKLTHQESLFNVMKAISSGKIQLSENIDDYIFTSNSKIVLNNYLTAGQFDKAHALIDTTYNSMQTASSSVKKQVYYDIIAALQELMKQRGITFTNKGTDDILNTLKKSADTNDEKFKEYIEYLLNLIIESMQHSFSKVDIQSVIEYIHEHYAEDIDLESLAEIYKTSAKYMSKRIKQHLNVPFKEYLTSLRIDKAVQLLKDTDITISELYWQVGFRNRSVFTRAFKLKTGLAPSEYKKADQSNMK